MKRLALTAAILAVSAAAMAQGPGGFGGPGGQRGGQGRGGFQGGPGGPGGFGGPMMNRQVSASTIPLKTLATYLSLSDAQIGKIALAREEVQEAMRPQMPQRGGQGGERPNFENIQARMQTAERKASSAIAAQLDAGQQKKLASLVKALQALQIAGVRPDGAVALKLTDDQIAQLASGASAGDVLSAEQQGVAESYRMPQGFGGGPGGPGGPPPGGFDGPGGPPPGQ